MDIKIKDNHTFQNDLSFNKLKMVKASSDTTVTPETDVTIVSSVLGRSCGKVVFESDSVIDNVIFTITLSNNELFSGIPICLWSITNADTAISTEVFDVNVDFDGIVVRCYNNQTESKYTFNYMLINP